MIEASHNNQKARLQYEALHIEVASKAKSYYRDGNF